MYRWIASLTLAAALTLLTAGGARADALELTIATPSPKESPSAKLLRDWGLRIEKRTGGQVKVKLVLGGTGGDERDIVRKVKNGQLQGAALTGIGLSLVKPDLRVLDLPFLFKDDADLDNLRKALEGELQKTVNQFIFLGWIDPGEVRLYSNRPIKSLDDLRKMKLWVWMDDPIVRNFFVDLKLPIVPADVPDVLPSLQTGRIDAVYGPPLWAFEMQWHTKTRYITSMVISQATGALVVSQAAWDKLKADQQKIVIEESRALSTKLLSAVRDGNKKALVQMKAKGLQIVETPAALSTELKTAATTFRSTLDGKLYAKEFRQKVEAELSRLR